MPIEDFVSTDNIVRLANSGKSNHDPASLKDFSSTDNILNLAGNPPDPPTEKAPGEEFLRPAPNPMRQQAAQSLFSASPAFRNQFASTPPPITGGRRQSQSQSKGKFGFTEQDIAEMVRQAESSGNYGALSDTSSASGAYQYVDATWNGYGGYSKAALAPPAVQDRRFMEDLDKRMQRYDGDLFKVLASHYLPAYADTPKLWDKPLTVYGHRVSPIAEYVRGVIEGRPKLENKFDEYLEKQQQNGPESTGGTS